jgi:hypothetical protein
MPVDIDDARPNLHGPPQRHPGEVFRGNTFRLGDSTKSIVSPVDWTAL